MKRKRKTIKRNTEKIIMNWNKLYHYPPCTRSTTDGLRTYEVGKEKLPSVTTILKATESDEKKAALEKWKKRVAI